MKKFLWFATALVCLWPMLSVCAQPARSKADPDAHDPVMAKGEDCRYYVFTTGWNVSVMSSADLVNWRQEPSALKETPQWAVQMVPGYRGHTWAPDISFHDGMWYLYYSCSAFGKNTSAIGLAVNRTLDPESEQFGWQDRGLVIASRPGTDNWNSIDPNLATDRKKRPYLVFGSFWDGVQMMPLDTDFQTPVSEPHTIARRLEQALPADSVSTDAGNNAIEAPFIYYRKGYYYLFVSFDYCCRGERSTYKTVYGRSKKIQGPYLDRDGHDMACGGGTLLFGPDRENYGIGHCAVYDMDGKTYFVSHAYTKAQDGRAKLFIRTLSFDGKGWIVTD